MMRLSLLLFACLSLSLVSHSAEPERKDTEHGDRIRDAYFRLQATQLADRALADIHSKADWEKKAPELRRQFLDMMGLWPLPKRTPLKPTITGTIDTPKFTVEKLHFQSIPGLYVTGNLYVPKKRSGPCPAILYVCGHGANIIDKVSYGNKITYQHHPAWYAENGYVCLIVDTLQLGEIQGLHHGTSRFGMWWWLSLGYTPAGIECWNGMRGIDYLQSRKEVDPERIGVTGRSGGGATSWWVGAADERVKAIIPVAGIADLLAHVSEGYPGRLADGVVAGHCDCMYMVNTYRWDYTMVIALCAPRALLLGNSDADVIFPVAGYRRMAAKIKKLYTLLGVPDRFALLETKGPHKDTPELRLGAFRWMNRWLKNDTSEVTEPERVRFKPQQLKVVDRAPGDAINDIVHEKFHQPVKLELPTTDAEIRSWWKDRSPGLLASLKERAFRGWPEMAPALDFKPAGEATHQGVRVRAFDFVSEQAVPLRMWLVQSAGEKKSTEVIAAVVDEAGWQQWLADLGPDFAKVLYAGGNPAPNPYPEWNRKRFDQLRRSMESYHWTFAIVAPRGVGPTRWSELSRFDNKQKVGHQIRRRFYLLGQTLEGQQIWDVRRAVACLAQVKDVASLPLTLQGKGDMGVLALYASLFEPTVKRLDLQEPPASHRGGPPLLNVLTVLDIPQAVALALPRQVTLHVKDAEASKAWQWPVRVQKALGTGAVQVKEGE